MNLNHGNHFFLKEKIFPFKNIITDFTYLYKKTSGDLVFLY